MTDLASHARKMIETSQAFVEEACKDGFPGWMELEEGILHYHEGVVAVAKDYLRLVHENKGDA